MKTGSRIVPTASVVVALVGAIAASALGCGGTTAAARPGETCWANSPCTPPAVRFDASFADGLRESFRGPKSANRLLTHPALRLMMQQEGADSPSTYFESMRARTQRRMPTWAALDFWKNRGPELVAAADESGEYLPRQVSTFPGTIFLVANEGRGTPTLPNIFFDITAQRFEERPEEVPYFIVHAAHHIGFLRLRPLPVLDSPSDVPQAKALVWGLTHMEGMAVHAARARRMKSQRVKEDYDYDAYASDEAAGRATQGFGNWLACLSSPGVTSSDTVAALEALSAGERLFFRFGSLVAARIEASAGREALIATIAHPERFTRVAEEVLKASGANFRCPRDKRVLPAAVD